ncbi:hypothetical protein BDW42DRAFT_119199 [Aspergillus taichungensis]|uniref:Uncharacterized protein n=1 Tax=Aspergillus taichungensis TaxID=482145 RepID=A0A2J5HRB9_9EURO|nr:hypothetical protein BDW42DRAFT_119199 [Aspergillus taichungensis]
MTYFIDLFTLVLMGYPCCVVFLGWLGIGSTTARLDRRQMADGKWQTDCPICPACPILVLALIIVFLAPGVHRRQKDSSYHIISYSHSDYIIHIISILYHIIIIIHDQSTKYGVTPNKSIS